MRDDPQKGTSGTLWALLVDLGRRGRCVRDRHGVLYRSGADVNRLYFGSDTHAQCLLVGTALAFGSCDLAKARVRNRTVAARAVLAHRDRGAGAGICAGRWSHLSLDQVGQSFVFEGGFADGLGLAAAVLLCAGVSTREESVSKALSFAPLRYLGRISYGVYLWHWPLDVALTESRVGVGGYELFGVRSGAAIAIATVSYYAIEQPIRRGSVLTRARAMVVTPVGDRRHSGRSRRGYRRAGRGGGAGPRQAGRAGAGIRFRRAPERDGRESIGQVLEGSRQGPGGR